MNFGGIRRDMWTDTLIKPMKSDTVVLTSDMDISGDTVGVIDRDSIVKEVLASMPWGPLEKCHGCDNASLGFKWDVEEEDGTKYERQMCLECLYRGMLVERTRKAEFDRKTLNK